MKTLDTLALGYAGALIGALCMLALGILGNLGIYTGAVAMMAGWHMFFSLSALGIAIGMVEAAVISFIILYIFGYAYNMFAKKG